MQCMVNIIIPLGGVSTGAAHLFWACRPLQIARLIAVVFEYEVDLSFRRKGTPDRVRQLRQNVRPRIISDSMNGI